MRHHWQTILLMICLLGSTFFFPACNGDSGKTEEPTSETLALSIKEIESSWESPGCKEQGNPCAKISLAYPEIGGQPEAVSKKINDTLNYYLSSNLMAYNSEQDQGFLSLDTIAYHFIRDYEELLDEEPEYTMEWFLELDAKVVWQNDRVMVIELASSSFTGGAHPNYYLSIINFDVETGARLENKSWIVDHQKLNELAEKKFRENTELGPEDNLNEAGFFWGNSFSLPENMGFHEKGIYMHYNPYEVAAYALGTISFVIEYSELEGIVDTKYFN